MNYKLEKVGCNYCGTKDYSIYIENAKELYNNMGDIFHVVRCNQCGFIFTNPRPTKETISYFYPDSAGYYQPQILQKTSTSFKKYLLNAILKNHYNYPFENKIPKALTKILLLFVKKRLDLLHTPIYVFNGRLLDIGCSWGSYIYKMHELGWNVYGVELNSKAIEFARKQLGLKNVYKGFIDDFEFEKEYFDVVHMNMVLEHLHAPLKTLKRINSIMKQGAQLILAVPDISGFEALVYKDKYYGLQVPQHLNHFTPKTLQMYINGSGFVVEKIVHHKFDRDIVASSSYLNDKRLYKFLSNRAIRKTLVKLFINFLSVVGKSSRMSVYARKIRKING